MGQERFTLLLPFLRDVFAHSVLLPGQSRPSHPHLLGLLVTFKLCHDWIRLPWRGFTHALGSCQIDPVCHAQFTGEKLWQRERERERERKRASEREREREKERDNFIEINRKHDDTCTNKKYNEGLCGLIQGDLR